MKKNKWFFFFVLAIFTFSIGSNYFLLKENNRLACTLGGSYQRTVINTINKLNELKLDNWIDVLKKEDGKVRLERNLTELEQLGRQFDYIGANPFSIIIHDIVEQYHQLSSILNNGNNNVDIQKRAINKYIDFMTTLLLQIKSDLGNDEKRWYNELSGNKSKTIKYIYERFNEFEKSNSLSFITLSLEPHF